jgi:hypothetical protein
MSFVERLIRSLPGHTRTQRNRRLPVVLFGILALAGLTACGPQQIKGRPPFIGISGMSLQGERLTADFRVSNQNDVPMTIQGYELAMSVDDTVLVRETRPFDLAIDANSAEELQVQREAGDAARDLLEALDRQERPSLPFELTGRVRTLEDGYLSFDHKGHLYPVPGRPGQFRSAVTQARELRREDDL